MKKWNRRLSATRLSSADDSNRGHLSSKQIVDDHSLMLARSRYEMESHQRCQRKQDRLLVRTAFAAQKERSSFDRRVSSTERNNDSQVSPHVVVVVSYSAERGPYFESPQQAATQRLA